MGVEGLLKGKKVYVFATRGGQYAGTPFDTQTGFIRNLLGLVGITDVEFIYAEGLGPYRDQGRRHWHEGTRTTCSTGGLKRTRSKLRRSS